MSDTPDLSEISTSGWIRYTKEMLFRCGARWLATTTNGRSKGIVGKARNDRANDGNTCRAEEASVGNAHLHVLDLTSDEYLPQERCIFAVWMLRGANVTEITGE